MITPGVVGGAMQARLARRKINEKKFNFDDTLLRFVLLF